MKRIAEQEKGYKTSWYHPGERKIIMARKDGILEHYDETTQEIKKLIEIDENIRYMGVEPKGKEWIIARGDAKVFSYRYKEVHEKLHPLGEIIHRGNNNARIHHISYIHDGEEEEEEEKIYTKIIASNETKLYASKCNNIATMVEGIEDAQGFITSMMVKRNHKTYLIALGFTRALYRKEWKTNKQGGEQQQEQQTTIRTTNEIGQVLAKQMIQDMTRSRNDYPIRMTDTPTGSHVIVPTGTDVDFINVETMNIDMDYRINIPSMPYQVTRSKNGRYMAVAVMKGTPGLHLYYFDTQGYHCIQKYDMQDCITNMQFHGERNDMVVTTDKGVYSIHHETKNNHTGYEKKDAPTHHVFFDDHHQQQCLMKDNEEETENFIEIPFGNEDTMDSETFQPGATQDYGGRRYLVKTLKHEVILAGVAIEVKLNNETFSFVNREKGNVIMAAANHHGVALGYQEGKKHAVAFYRGVTKVFCYPLERETLDAMAMTNHQLCIATRYVPNPLFDKMTCYRLSFYDIQGGVFKTNLALPGRVMSMVGRRNRLFVVYQKGHQLHFMLMDLIRHTTLAQAELVLTTNAQLKWIGLDDHGCPITFDAAGVVRLGNPDWNYTFTEIYREAITGQDDAKTFMVGIDNECIYYYQEDNDAHPVNAARQLSSEKFNLPQPLRAEGYRELEGPIHIAKMYLNERKRDLFENDLPGEVSKRLKDKPMQAAMRDFDKRIVHYTEACLNVKAIEPAFNMAHDVQTLRTLHVLQQMATDYGEMDLLTKFEKLESILFGDTSTTTMPPKDVMTNLPVPLVRPAPTSTASLTALTSPTKTLPAASKPIEVTTRQDDNMLMTTKPLQPHTPSRPSIFSPKKSLKRGPLFKGRQQAMPAFGALRLQREGPRLTQRQPMKKKKKE